MQPIQDWQDAFGDQIAKGTRNAIDLPAYYDFNEERYRFIENGTRVQDPDADSTRFTDQDEQFLIEPSAGDTLEFKTAEAPRYVVGNDTDVSWSFQFVTPLVDASDSFTLFIEDAFEIEYDGAGNVTFRSLEDGSEKASAEVEPPNGLDSPSRPELAFNWYAVGRAEVTIDYTEGSEQKTTEPATITVDDDWLSDDPTGRVGFRLDVSNPGIQLEAGSLAYIVKSQTPPTSRPKPYILPSTVTNDIPADGFGAIAALRIDPERDNVFTDLKGIQAAAEETVDVQVWAKAVPPSKTDADFDDPDGDGTSEGPAPPPSNSPQNSVMQVTTDVSTFPTRTDPLTGTEVPAGRLVGLDSTSISGQGSKTQATDVAADIKRPLYPDEVVVLVGETPESSTATAVTVFGNTEQDW